MKVNVHYKDKAFVANWSHIPGIGSVWWYGGNEAGPFSLIGKIELVEISCDLNDIYLEDATGPTNFFPSIKKDY